MSTPQTAVRKRATLLSYAIIFLPFILIAWLHLVTLLLSTFVSYYILTKLRFGKRLGKKPAVAVFLILLLAVSYGITVFTNQTIASLPEIADRAIPSVLQWAERFQVPLPFTDFESLKQVARETLSNQTNYLRKVAGLAGAAVMHLTLGLIGCVVAVNLFLNSRLELDRPPSSAPDNLYSLVCDEIAQRFVTFYNSFTTVIGAQLIISTFNTCLTACFVLLVGYPHPVVIIGTTFLCGLLPVIGNLISNSIIVCIGFEVSAGMAMLALLYLVVIHKLEYFLNSKIIGDRIRNPLWLTLLGLLLGERLMGIPGMILAPVVLHYVKTETSRIAVPDETPTSAP